MKLGIFGGTFAPLHTAHLIIAERFREQARLDKCLFVPAHSAPLRSADESLGLFTPQMRRRLALAAIAGNPAFELEPFELDSGKKCYTIDTLRYLSGKRPGAELFLLIGGDQAYQFDKWKDWREILRLAKLCVAARPDTVIPKELDAIIIESPLLEISATEIRNRLAAGKSIKYLVPAEVERALLQARS
ncbi:MAG: nicotinate (nicotinamide) nucleotide adenylyltransferase [Chloroflexota bacterium]